MTKFKDIIFEPNVAIHCPEEWMANELLKYADSKGYKWNANNRYADRNYWFVEEQNTVYYIRSGVYGGINYAKENNYKVLHYNYVVIKEGEEREKRGRRDENKIRL